MADMTRLVLNELLERFERSKLFREGTSTRRILIDVPGHKVFSGLQEQADDKKEFLDTLADLQDKGLIGYSWVRFETGNLIEKVWLETDPDALRTSYRLANRPNRRDALLSLEDQLCCTLKEINRIPNHKKPRFQEDNEVPCQVDEAASFRGNDMASFEEDDVAPFEEDDAVSFEEDDIACFLIRELEFLRSKKKISRFFFHSGKNNREDQEKNRNLLLFLRELQNREDNRIERVLSMALYGDSKYFERELKQKVLSILRALAKEDGREDLTDEELLEERGLFRWPEILEFCGPLSVILDDGSVIHYEEQVFGAYINSTTVRHIARIQIHEPLRIISIENKANYTWYLTNAMQAGELVLYHGGCFSPSKGKWFRLIAEAIHKTETKVLHWSDIDLGGFRIFRRFRDELFPQAIPWKMDVRTLETHMAYCVPLGSDIYRNQLKSLTENPAYDCFSDTILFMLKKDIRLEQEAEII